VALAERGWLVSPDHLSACQVTARGAMTEIDMLTVLPQPSSYPPSTIVNRTQNVTDHRAVW
jgi:hypothetical protein